MTVLPDPASFPLTGPARLWRPTLDLLRALPARVSALGQGAAPAPRILFMPSGPISDGAVRLRIHAPARALARMGWRVTVMPWRLSLEGRRRFLDALAPDLVVMQGLRHPLNRPALYPGRPILLDMDDADFHLDHLEAPLRAAMPGLQGVIAGSRYIADWCLAHGAPRADVVWTGTPPARHAPPEDRPPVIAWAQTAPLTYSREADLVAETMARVAARRPGITLRLYDRRGGAGERDLLNRLSDAGVILDWRPPLSYRAWLASLHDVAVGLAPLCPETPFSRGKSFGKVLGYLDRGAAIVASPAGEHTGFFTRTTAHLATTPDDWATAILHLLDDAPARAAMARAARTDFLTHLTTDAAAARLDDILAAAMAKRARP